jgi:hypothetical protein
MIKFKYWSDFCSIFKVYKQSKIGIHIHMKIYKIKLSAGFFSHSIIIIRRETKRHKKEDPTKLRYFWFENYINIIRNLRYIYAKGW